MSDLWDMGLVLRPVVRDAAETYRIDEASLAPLRCDLSIISDESTPAEETVAAQVEQIESPRLQQLHWDVLDRLRSAYDTGGMVPHAALLLQRIREGAAATGVEPAELAIDALLAFFERVNRALFVQQTILWLAGSAFKVHLYGNGWERHQSLAPWHLGVVASDAQRLAVWRASRINLAAGPYGAVDANVIDGITAGGFFLMRFCPGDVIERVYPPIAEFCAAHGIRTNAALDDAATPGIRRVLALASRTLGIDVLDQWPSFVAQVLSSAADGKPRSAAALWSDYPKVAFSTRDELLGLATKYLYDGPERLRLADAMRRELIERATHVRVSVHRRLLSGIAPGEVAA